MRGQLELNLYVSFILGLFTIAVGLLILRTLQRNAKVPPGPSWRSFGRLPTTHRWRTFHDWHKKFGSVVLFYLGSETIVLLASAQAAHDLLKVKGNVYSGRPRCVVGHEIYSPLHGIGMSDGPVDETHGRKEDMEIPRPAYSMTVA
ncbi:hypothetical protein BDZ89DRAFT_1128311 [Hymenopellis radicata]|nr:hypothetical protein BDZ89DRAFT_1128311 [Hymenopellis radicata]